MQSISFHVKSPGMVLLRLRVRFSIICFSMSEFLIGAIIFPSLVRFWWDRVISLMYEYVDLACQPKVININCQLTVQYQLKSVHV